MHYFSALLNYARTWDLLDVYITNDNIEIIINGRAGALETVRIKSVRGIDIVPSSY